MSENSKSTALKVRHLKHEHRFVMDIDGLEAEVIYHERSGKLHLVHAEVPVELRGQNYGKILVEKTFEKLDEEGYKAIAVCPFIVATARRSERWRNIIG